MGLCTFAFKILLKVKSQEMKDADLESKTLFIGDITIKCNASLYFS